MDDGDEEACECCLNSFHVISRLDGFDFDFCLVVVVAVVVVVAESVDAVVVDADEDESRDESDSDLVRFWFILSKDDAIGSFSSWLMLLVRLLFELVDDDAAEPVK